MKTHAEAEQKLLEEGVESYVPAISAILRFRELVISLCRRVVEPRLPEYGTALGVSLNKRELVPVIRPPESQWGGDWGFVSLQFQDFGEAKCSLYHGLYWELGEDGKWISEIGVGTGLRKREQVRRLWEAFAPHRSPNLGLFEETKEIWLPVPVSRANIADFEKKLDSVLCQWIELWKKAGGLAVLASANDS